MTVLSSAAGDVVTGLVTVARDSAGFRDPSTNGTDVPVFDGSIVSGSSAGTAVVIGGTGEPDGLQRPVRFQSGWHDLDRTLEERGTVQCSVVTWSGDANPTTFADQRATVFDALADLDAALRANNLVLDVGVSRVLWTVISGGELLQGVTSKGTRTNLQFGIDYYAYLTVT
jgi:hypothetical protein